MSPETPTPRSRGRISTVLSFAALLAVGMAGCTGAGPSIHTVRRGIEQQVPHARFETETQITLGRISLGLTKKLLRLAMDEEDEQEVEFLFSLKKVEVGVYRVRLSAEERDALTLPRSFERALRRGGWQTLVKTRDEGEHAWVFLRPERRPEGEILRSLYVVTYDGDELVLVHVEGRIDEIFKAIAEEDPEGVAALLVDELG